MFKVGDIVEITEVSSATGMLDFKDGKGYEVTGVNSTGSTVRVTDESGHLYWYHCTHFKLKEDAKVEKKECLFKEGQEVHCVLGGEGVVSHIYPQSAYPVKVYFANDTVRDYTKDGRLHEGDINRALFFSPTVVTGATEPAFEPVLKEGDVVVAVDKDGCSEMLNVKQELECQVKNDRGTLFYKEAFTFYRLGEKINFK